LAVFVDEGLADGGGVGVAVLVAVSDGVDVALGV
jgi:hypothetical protein